MAASEQVTGPVAVWIAVPIITLSTTQVSQTQPPTTTATTTPVPLFFGWGETAPEPEFNPEFEPIMSDLAGSRKPHDKLYQGTDARVTAAFTIWDELVYNAMLAVTKSGQPGTDGPLDVGTLMNAEKKSFQMWLAYPYGIQPTAKPFMTAAGMRQGYHFFGAYLEGPQRRQQGTKVNKVLISWYCSRVFRTSFGLNTVGYQCYDMDMSAILGKAPAINPR